MTEDAEAAHASDSSTPSFTLQLRLRGKTSDDEDVQTEEKCGEWLARAAKEAGKGEPDERD